MTHKIYLGMLSLVMIAGMAACTRETVNSDGRNPYGDPVLASIIFAENAVRPAKGFVNDEVLVRGTGFLKHKDKLEISFNGEKAEILEVTDSAVKVRVPAFASSGNINAKVGDEFYYGPFYNVFGPLQMDTVFPSLRGANAMINTIIAANDGKWLIAGRFNNYDNANKTGGVNRMARVLSDGKLDNDFEYGWQTGPQGDVNAAVYLQNEQKFLVAGYFNRYARTQNVYSIARLNFNGTNDSALIELPSQNMAVGSSLAGGVRGTVYNMHVLPDEKILLVGDFRYYVKPNYNLTSSIGLDSMHLDSTFVQHMIRLHPDGVLDTSWNYDLQEHRGLNTVNGRIYKSEVLPDGKILIAGNFTTYQGQPAPRIARLNADGTLDASFNPGSGADLLIYDFYIQPDGKIIVAGGFNRFNGVSANRVVRIMPNGAVDPGFSVGAGPDGNKIDQIGLLPNGAIILTGTFRKFGNLTRNNFIVLNADGTVHPTYNTIGGLRYATASDNGSVTEILPVQGQKAVMMVGNFDMFDGRPANRIVKLVFE
ncbi:IPT/TIG domain-containing protein [Chitinophaga deserti]|uniref:IPT/TIG domain-containing protein n=1 Tax=Chitinophaga deserti TaxID=2164099 RepID=UPI0018E4F4A1|nr:IPT/TIG domain-containing protein [Chitinophaga deserti]